QTNSSVTIRLPQAGDESLSGESVQNLSSESEEKKNPEPIKIELPIEDEPEEIGTAESVKFTPNENQPPEKDKKRLESDQEKMVLELFDGKYIE
ncbi:hypothetical protein IKQ21_05885, partial [bacterium]|nr:hypothetical protein [bacterium]